MGFDTDDGLAEIKARLTDRLEELAEALLGPPSPETRRHPQWGWSGTGGAFLVVRGHKRGAFYCHSGGDGGGPLDLIMFARSCDFLGALEWAKAWLGITDAPLVTPVDAAVLLERTRKRAAAAVEAEADERKRIAFARVTWGQSVPIAGTIAERYLTEARAIQAPGGGWPAETVGFHPASRALILAMTDASGAVQAVQRIYLTPDARKIDKAEAETRRLPGTKGTNGVMEGAAVRLSGSVDGPLLLAEGPETGLSVWAATGAEMWIALGGVAKLTLPHGRRIIVCADDDAAGSPAARKLAEAIDGWRAAGADVLVATPWAELRGNKTDFNDAIQAGGADAVRERIAAAVASVKHLARAHYPRPHLTGDAASARLRKVVEKYLDRVERHLEAHDWIAAEAERIEDSARCAAEARILVKLTRLGMDSDDAAEEAAKRAAKVAPGVARRQARRDAARKFGRRAASGTMPRIQIKGAAGLGKTQAIIDEYACRPSLWKRHITVYARDLDLCDGFAARLEAATREVPTAPDGSRPRAVVIRGRQSAGMCDSERLKVVEEAQKAGCDSIFRACCHTPASGELAESFCPKWQGCSALGYVAQFLDHGPGLRLMTHARLGLAQPTELRLPEPDLVIVDESAIDALIVSATVDPAILTELATYNSELGEEHLIQEAVDTGRQVIGALPSGGEAVTVLQAAGTTPDHLRAAAKAATLAATKAQPSISAGMNADRATDRLRQTKRHPGRAVAAVLAQLARDMEAARCASIGVEYDAANKARLDNGAEVLHPIIRQHGIKSTLGAPSNVALLLLDADASLEINRRLFGVGLRAFNIPAVRLAHVTQVSDYAVAKSSLAPSAGLPNNQAKAAKLRERIAQLVQRETADGKKVLVIAPLQVRRALTGEKEDQVPVSARWRGADLTHFGRHLGNDDWRNHDTAIVIGREELPPLVAERHARAIWADADGVSLNLPGGDYGRELRRHDLREGTAPAVKVRAHADPRVQSIVEISRECAVGQALDRLRLIHRDPARPAGVVVLTNLPIPGLVVDRLMTLDDVLAGGTVWERAFALVKGGVLPLSPDWLAANTGGLFGRRSTAAGLVADRVQVGNIDTYCRIGLYRLPGQKCPSKALIQSGVIAPRAELARLHGVSIDDVRLIGETPAQPIIALHPPLPAEAPVAPPSRAPAVLTVVPPQEPAPMPEPAPAERLEAEPAQVVAARAAWLLQWVETAWEAWQADEVEVAPVRLPVGLGGFAAARARWAAAEIRPG